MSLNSLGLVINGLASLAIVPSIYVFWYCKRLSLPFAWVLWLYMLAFAVNGFMSFLKIPQPEFVDDLIWVNAAIRVAIAVATPFAVHTITSWPGPKELHRTCNEMASQLGRAIEMER